MDRIKVNTPVAEPTGLVTQAVEGPGVTFGTHKTLQSTGGCTRASFNCGLMRKHPVHFSMGDIMPVGPDQERLDMQDLPGAPNDNRQVAAAKVAA